MAGIGGGSGFAAWCNEHVTSPRPLAVESTVIIPGEVAIQRQLLHGALLQRHSLHLDSHSLQELTQATPVGHAVGSEVLATPGGRDAPVHTQQQAHAACEHVQRRKERHWCCQGWDEVVACQTR